MGKKNLCVRCGTNVSENDRWFSIKPPRAKRYLDLCGECITAVGGLGPAEYYLCVKHEEAGLKIDPAVFVDAYSRTLHGGRR